MRASIGRSRGRQNCRSIPVSDGELGQFLWLGGRGWICRDLALDPALNTLAESVEEAFVMARDAWELLKEFRSAETEATIKRGTGPKAIGKRLRRPRTSVVIHTIQDVWGLEGHRQL